jgi:hypothetical protein
MQRANIVSPCMLDNSSTKHFPKRYSINTTIDDDGIPIYRRQDNGRHFKRGGSMLDNRFVVPYNQNQMSRGSIKYLTMLLTLCIFFEDIRTINGVVHPTCKSACEALRYLEEDSEWIEYFMVH